MSKCVCNMVVDKTTGMNFVPITGGDFMMGSPLGEKDRLSPEGPQHKVHVEDFHMACCEVTQEQYVQIMGENPSFVIGENCPVDGVSWEDAQMFIKKLNELSGTCYRLPSEAEWEYACRAHTTTRFFFGDDINVEQANYGSKISCTNCPVGTHPANDFGLFDMHGNVFEWCEDTWHENYEGAPLDGTAWIDETTDHKVYRGGGWNANAHFVRSAYRYHRPQTFLYYNIGFRLAF